MIRDGEKRSRGSTAPASAKPPTLMHTCSRSRGHLNADTIRRGDEISLDAVVVVSRQYRHFSGRDILIAWNHHFGWSLGIEGRAAIVS